MMSLSSIKRQSMAKKYFAIFSAAVLLLLLIVFISRIVKPFIYASSNAVALEAESSALTGSVSTGTDTSASAGQYIQFQSPSFSFATGGDLGASSNTSATLDLIAKSSSNFVLALGDLDYGELLPESAWCTYVQNHLGANLPLEIISGNHEDGG